MSLGAGGASVLRLVTAALDCASVISRGFSRTLRAAAAARAAACALQPLQTGVGGARMRPLPPLPAPLLDPCAPASDAETCGQAHFPLLMLDGPRALSGTLLSLH